MGSSHFHIAAVRYVLLLFMAVGIGNSSIAGHQNAGNNFPQPIEHPLGDMEDSSESESDDKEFDDDNLYDGKSSAMAGQYAIKGWAGELDQILSDPSFALIYPPPKF